MPWVAYVGRPASQHWRGSWDRQRAKSMGGQFVCPLSPEGRGSRPTAGRAPGCQELQRQWGAVPTARALALLQSRDVAQRTHCPAYSCQAEWTEDPTATKAGQMRWGQVAGPLLSGPPNLSWCLEPRKSYVPSVLNEKLQVYLPFLFFIWESKGRLFLYSQHFWQVCKFFTWDNSSVLCGIQLGVLQLNSFWH